MSEVTLSNKTFNCQMEFCLFYFAFTISCGWGPLSYSYGYLKYYLRSKDVSAGKHLWKKMLVVLMKQKTGIQKNK
jgi:hypothetical protein